LFNIWENGGPFFGRVSLKYSDKNFSVVAKIKTYPFFLIGKMTVFGTIFEVNSSIGKLWNLLGHSDKKDTVDF